jgi:nucleoside-diphosphate-sugar epimerase
MKVLVIGGNGYLGRRVIDRLMKDGHSAVSFHRTPWAEPHPFPGVVQEKIGERADLPTLARELRTDVVIDMVCANGAEFRSLVRSFEGYAFRIAILSSADVYRTYEILMGHAAGPLQSTPILEDGAYRNSRYPYRGSPSWFYNWYYKVLVEEAARESSELPTTMLRMPVVYGPGDSHCLFRWYLTQMEMGKATVPFDEIARGWRGCWGYVEK